VGENKLGVFEREILSKTFGPKDKKKDEFEKITNEEWSKIYG